LNGELQVPSLSLVPKEDAVPQASPATIDIADFTSDVIRREARRTRVIEVRDHGQLLGGFLSATELERYRNLVRRDVEVFRAGEFPDDVVAALEDSVGKFGVGVE
jgi:hypothetical protein